MADSAVLIDQAIAQGKLTTVGYINKNWTTPPVGSRWANMLALLDQAKAALPPPVTPPTSDWPIAPQGALVLVDGARTKKRGVYYDAFSVPSAENGRTDGGYHITNCLEEGYGFLFWNSGLTPPVKDSPAGSVWHVRDVIAENIYTNSNLNGTTEFCFRSGQLFDMARLVAKNPGWCAHWMGGRAMGKLSDFNYEALGHVGSTGNGNGKVGIYVEHAAHDIWITRGTCHATGTAINGEWWYTESTYASFMEAAAKAAYPGRAGPYKIKVGPDVTLTSDEGAGVYWGPGMYGCDVRGVKFVGCPQGAIVLPKRLANTALPNTIDLASCDFSQCVGPQVVYEDLPMGSMLRTPLKLRASRQRAQQMHALLAEAA